MFCGSFEHESQELTEVSASIRKAAIDYGSAHFDNLRPGHEPSTTTGHRPGRYIWRHGAAFSMYLADSWLALPHASYRIAG